MNRDHRQKAFVALGQFLTRFTQSETSIEYSKNEAVFAEKLEDAIRQACFRNGWFTEENIKFALTQWGQALTKENLSAWLANYAPSENSEKKVAIIMAGNIPLVGFHDLLCVLLAGHRAIIRQSSNDRVILPVLIDFLIAEDQSLKEAVIFSEERLSDFDAVIATGSNNTGRYFEHYFSKKPNIIRKNRNSVAVLTGKESKEELATLGEDIFRYYGLGCRNVSKLLVPKNYNFNVFFEAVYDWHPIINQHKYANNYDYNKAVYLMSEFKLLDNNFLILKEEKEKYASPISVLFYEYYQDEAQLQQKLETDQNQLQCVVSAKPEKNQIKFGKTQQPGLADYADQVDTMKFLLNL